MMIPTHNLDLDPTKHSFATVGFCVDTFPAMINHSCDANVTWINNGRELRFIALRDIQPGEELTTSYVAERVQFALRKEQLLKWWGIDCECKWCTTGDLPATSAELTDDIMKIHDIVRKRELPGRKRLERVLKEYKEGGHK